MLAPYITFFAQRVAPALIIEVPYFKEQCAANPNHAVYSFSYLVSAVCFFMANFPTFYASDIRIYEIRSRWFYFNIYSSL
jgi:hypothetical protein